ncbi:hypothetical protein ACRALDRAFT_1066356 [Sodiomyces alcalophilus JCM 7366]|uniref:uncharacterized protein n=1 Tax=Sodiomyces alcalophilus JCM 7366 TaxID=591952 RepID=UPI0039B3A8F9
MTVYFELGWAILSTICLANVLFGLMVVNITSLSPAAMVPIVVSVAGAVANGLCFYAYYGDYPLVNTAVASVIADVMWLIQEAGMSFYSYIILVRILFDWNLRIFKLLFWSIMCIIAATRVAIATFRAVAILNGDERAQHIINRLHVGYFTAIALVECVSAFYLLRKFTSAKRSSRQASLPTALFRHLMRSTEVRVATLALIGTARALTYYSQPSSQKASSVSSQIDRFLYTMECMFPVMLFIDLLASKLVFHNEREQYSLPRVDTGSRVLREESEVWNSWSRSSRRDRQQLPSISSGAQDAVLTGTELSASWEEAIERPPNAKVPYPP